MNDRFLSNTYVVGDEDGGTAVMIDAGGPVEPLLEAIERHGLNLSHVLLTHRHYDHVCELDKVLARHPDAQVLGHEAEVVEARTGTIAPDTEIHPGHTDPTTVADEWEGNAFVRVWRGLDPEGHEACTAMGEPATLVLLADDYDGGHKAWVRWPDGRDDIVPGSQVQRG